MRLEAEGGAIIDNPSDSDLFETLEELDGVDDSYAYLTAPNGSYVQVGGGPSEFTVEWREIRPDGSFRHLKAASLVNDPAEKRLDIGGAEVTVRADQILSSVQVRRIFEKFLHGERLDPELAWDDMTAMFKQSS